MLIENEYPVEFHYIKNSKFTIEVAAQKIFSIWEKTKERMFVYTDIEESTNELDKILWTMKRNVFLPHGTYQDSHPQDQPILITNQSENEVINGASITIFLRVLPKKINMHSLIIFDSKTSIVEELRKMYVNLKNQKKPITYCSY